MHSALGPGLLESAYESCLAYELNKRGLNVERQKKLPLIYDGLKIDEGYRIDIFVESCVVLELKSVDAITPLHKAQLLSYLKLSKCPVGLLINFNVTRILDGLLRIAN